MTICEEKYEAIQEMIASEHHNAAMIRLEELVADCDDQCTGAF